MKVFIYSLRDYDEQDFMVEFCSQYGLEYGYTAETPCMDNLHMAEGYDAVNIITTPTDKAMIDGWIDAGVKCIATRTIGYDHIDYRYAASKGVGVVNVTYSPATVAEYTVMMILMGLRRVKHIRERAELQDFSLKGKIARELCQCTVGIVGTGRIGEAVIDCLSGFGCKILAYDPFEKESVKERAEYVTLDKLLSESYIISLHAPALDGTYH
ncbi:MAG: lactate dehydrogenase, partial [Firmicutes bacterium]|nr:lactate dehydrogenase [Bacillota bacterium]